MNDKLTSLTRDRTTPTAVFIRVLVAVFLITLIVATAITFILPESYASTARIKVESDTPPAAGQLAYDPYFMQTAMEVIQSQIVLNPVIEKLSLNIEWGKRNFFWPNSRTSETMKILQQRLRLVTLHDTKFIAITVYSDDRQEAARIANAIAESYRDYRINSGAELKAKGIVVLEQQYKFQEEQIHTAQSEVESLRQQFKIAGDAAVSHSPPEQPYWDKKQDLSQLLDLHKALFARIEAAQLDAQMPHHTLVQITDTAEPGRAPVRPNKPLNITLGAVAGIFLGMLAGGMAAFIIGQFGKRTTQTTIPAGPGMLGVSSIALNPSVTLKTKIFGILFYSIATVLVLLAAALTVSGSVTIGSLLMVMGVALALSTAIRLGHLKRW